MTGLFLPDDDDRPTKAEAEEDAAIPVRPYRCIYCHQVGQHADGCPSWGNIRLEDPNG